MSEVGGGIRVASGDHKTAPDEPSKTFKTARCRGFITESTFGPVDLSLDAAGHCGRGHESLAGRLRRHGRYANSGYLIAVQGTAALVHTEPESAGRSRRHRGDDTGFVLSGPCPARNGSMSHLKQIYGPSHPGSPRHAAAPDDRTPGKPVATARPGRGCTGLCIRKMLDSIIPCRSRTGLPHLSINATGTKCGTRTETAEPGNTHGTSLTLEWRGGAEAPRGKSDGRKRRRCRPARLIGTLPIRKSPVSRRIMRANATASLLPGAAPWPYRRPAGIPCHGNRTRPKQNAPDPCAPRAPRGAD